MRARLLMIVAVLVVAGMISSSGVATSSEVEPWYYRQRLDWTPCADNGLFMRSAECARLAVPLDYAKPDGARVSLGVQRELADRILDRQADGFYAPGGLDVRLAVDCVDAAFPADPVATLTRLRTSAGPGGTWRLPATDIETLVCPHRPVTEPITGAPDLPALVIATTGDAATPYAGGVAMAARLGARLVTYRGYRHTVYLASDDCVNRIGHDYLINLRAPAEHTRCGG